MSTDYTSERNGQTPLQHGLRESVNSRSVKWHSFGGCRCVARAVRVSEALALHSAYDENLRRETQPAVCGVFAERFESLTFQFDQLMWRKRGDFFAKLVGHFKAQGQEVFDRDRRFYGELQQAFRSRLRASVSENFAQFAKLSEAESIESVWSNWRRSGVTIDNPRQCKVKGILFGKVPDGQRQLRAWLEHAQQFAEPLDGSGKEHCAKAADDRVESVRGKWQMVGKSDVKMYIFHSEMVGGATRGGHHLRDWIDTHNASLRSDDLGDTQRRLAGTGGNIEHRVLRANFRIRNQRLRNRRKHLADDFAVFFPIWRRTAPAIDNFLFRLHGQKYSSRHAAPGT